ncbi:MAG: hypothetical protein CGW95_12215 [Phenylobacterium zucineum]|nr:MAG: hypothetical protein CGW95_12215 [Phenylobacterium zucineum]
MSFLGDLVGSFAESGAKGLNDISARNQREAEMQQQNDLAIQRQKAAEAIRLDLEEQQRQAKQQRLSDQRQQVEAAAPAVTQARELSQAQQVAPSVDRNVLDTIKSKLSPTQLQKYYGVDTGPVAALDDKLTASRQLGNYDAEAVLQNERKETVASIAAARKDALETRRLDQGDNKMDTLMAIAAGHDKARTDAADIRANAPGKAGGDSVTKLMDQTRKRMDALIKNGQDDTQEYKDLSDYWTGLLEEAKAGRAASRAAAGGTATPTAAPKPAATPAAKRPPLSAFNK